MKLLLRQVKEHYMDVLKHFYKFDEEVNYEEYKDKPISAFYVDPDEYSLYFYPDLDDEEEYTKYKNATFIVGTTKENK